MRLTLITILSLLQFGAIHAQSLYISDSARSSVSCGNLNNITSSPDSMQITASGNCLSGGATPQAVPISGITVSEGQSSSTDVRDYGITVQLPVIVSSVTQPAVGLGSVSHNGTVILYSAPAAGTIGATAKDAVFSYSIRDGSGGVDSASVTVRVNPVDPGSGGGCVSTATLKCKGVISLDNVEIRGNQLSPGVIDVWTFTFDKDRSGYFTQVSGQQKTVIISLFPDDSLQNPLSPNCLQTTWGNTGIFAFNSEANATVWECPLTVGKTYYLKFRLNGTLPDDDYFLKSVDTSQ